MSQKKLAEKFSSKSILFINYYFPPIGAIGSIRNMNVANLSANVFKQVYVHSTFNKYLYPSNNLVLDKKIKTSYLPTIDYQTIKFLLNKIKNNKKTSASQNQNQNRNWAKRLSQFPLNLILGEGGFVYILFNFISILFKIHKIDYIYSSYSPHSDHYIAFLFKKLFPRIIWIADFRDIPLTDLDGNQPNNWENLFNNKIIKRANYLFTVSKGLANVLSELNSNTIVLRNGISDFLLQPQKINRETIQLNKNKFNISYTGALYQGKRDPIPLFQTIRTMIDSGELEEEFISLNYAGRESSLWEKLIKDYQLENVNHTYGSVAFDDAIYLQKNSDINLLLSWASPQLKGVLTGKFYEYLAARNPILLILRGIRDEEFEEIFEDLDAGLVINVDDSNNEFDSLKSFISTTFKKWKTNDIKKIDLQKLENYTWKKVYEEAFLKI